ncbi:pyridoxamine 5'-phosphate oxidase family protein [Eubacteriales bacterium OttesenSCG-928-A19]|nr:pyridoxamine 5'-phosphate oxidase family protein [Eubacteriales bacterium OttesenSCG-928-A19]
MRRKERELTSPDDLADILARGMVCRVALHDTPYPYIVPLNYGFVREDGRFALYFHCAREGTKLDLMRRDAHVAFEVEGETRLIEGDAACEYSAAFESVIGQGLLTEVSGEEKRAGMTALMRQVAPERDFDIPDAALARVTILRLDVERMTGKRSPVRKA